MSAAMVFGAHIDEDASQFYVMLMERLASRLSIAEIASLPFDTAVFP